RGAAVELDPGDEGSRPSQCPSSPTLTLTEEAPRRPTSDIRSRTRGGRRPTQRRLDWRFPPTPAVRGTGAGESHHDRGPIRRPPEPLRPGRVTPAPSHRARKSVV